MEGDFDKTRIPVRLVQHNGLDLVSRSQAKRLLARCDHFREVELDFDKVDSVGPAFADEIFRVFAQRHPEITVREVNVTPDVAKMIKAARRSAGAPPP